ncbi:MAG: hypothetical protein LBC10_04470 [Deltaproteobacteria bacterium]|jgi:hypothetical protein|nr:hypothetical protein [Deltaproteobacteria bacterium]
MEQALLKMARQLDALDEASLVALWDKYSGMAARFEPSKRWEESVLVLSLIQAKRWKNLLFNQQWSARSRPDEHPPRVVFSLENGERGDDAGKPKAKILAFNSRIVKSGNEEPDPCGTPG